MSSIFLSFRSRGASDDPGLRADLSPTVVTGPYWAMRMTARWWTLENLRNPRQTVSRLTRSAPSGRIDFKGEDAGDHSRASRRTCRKGPP